MSLNGLLEAGLLRCKAECEALSAELQEIMVGADPQNLIEHASAIRSVLNRLKIASDRLHDATIALKNVVQTRLR
jgi:hypothetical protein